MSALRKIPGSVTEHNSDLHGYAPSAEALGRLEEARVRDMAFRIRHLSGNTITRSDAHQVARILINLLNSDTSLTEEAIVSELMQKGRSRDKSLALTQALFGKPSS